MATLSDKLKAKVRKRANQLCEYCHTNEIWQYVPFTVDHITPTSLGGKTELENLALACFHCNRRKSNVVKAIDPETNTEVELFHPRKDVWSEHFIWSKDRLYIVASTAVGRATLIKLELNRERVIHIRAEDVLIGRHPPEGDPMQDE